MALTRATGARLTDEGLPEVEGTGSSVGADVLALGKVLPDDVNLAFVLASLFFWHGFSRSSWCSWMSNGSRVVSEFHGSLDGLACPLTSLLRGSILQKLLLTGRREIR